jgi:hypothetical protein
MSWGLGLASGLGFITGAAVLLFIGAPPFAPSYLHMHAKLYDESRLAEAQAGRAEGEADNRKAEQAQAVASVTGQRTACADQLDAQARVYETALDQMEARYAGTENACPDDRGLVSVRGLYEPRSPELADG